MDGMRIGVWLGIALLLIGVALVWRWTVGAKEDREKKALRVRAFFKSISNELGRHGMALTLEELEGTPLSDHRWEITGTSPFQNWGYRVVLVYGAWTDCVQVEFDRPDGDTPTGLQEAEAEVHESLVHLIAEYLRQKSSERFKFVVGDCYLLSDEIITAPQQVAKAIISQTELYHQLRILTNSHVKDLSMAYERVRLKQEMIKDTIADFFHFLRVSDPESPVVVEFEKRNSVPPASV